MLNDGSSFFWKKQTPTKAASVGPVGLEQHSDHQYHNHYGHHCSGGTRGVSGSPVVSLGQSAGNVSTGSGGAGSASSVAQFDFLKYRLGGVLQFPVQARADQPDARRTPGCGGSVVHRLLTDDEMAQRKPTRWTILEIHSGVKALSPAIFELRFLTHLYLSNNQLSRIRPEISQLVNLVLLDLSNNMLRSLPAEMGEMTSLCFLLLNNNKIRLLPYELGKLFRLQTLALAHNPLSPELSKVYQDLSGDKKLREFLLDHLAMNTSPPPQRQWVHFRHIDPDKPVATFSLLNYNILCDKYATSSLYSYCPQWALNWEYRKQYIVKDLNNYNADIVTLQEVETDQYRQLFLPKMESVGYSGIFYPKSRSKTMNEEEKKYVDGCAIFWKSNKFELERHELIEFTKVAMDNAQAHENMLNRVHPRDNIALIAVLKIKDQIYKNNARPATVNESVTNSMLVICTAHIHWDPEFCDVKLIQSMMLVHELEKMLTKLADECHLQKEQIPVLVCGDFNSLPDSGVFEFLSRGAISKDHTDFKSFREDSSCLSCLSANKTDLQHFTHALRLDSAVDSSLVPYTNFTLDFKGMIDYIFATPQSLARIAVLGPLDQSWVRANKLVGFPQPHMPSDHIPIMATYAIVPKAFQRTIPPPPFLNPVTHSNHSQRPHATQQISPSSSHTQNQVLPPPPASYFGSIGGGRPYS